MVHFRKERAARERFKSVSRDPDASLPATNSRARRGAGSRLEGPPFTRSVTLYVLALTFDARSQPSSRLAERRGRLSPVLRAMPVTITSLPAEVLVNVFECVAESDHYSNAGVAPCLRVCSQWKVRSFNPISYVPYHQPLPVASRISPSQCSTRGFFYIDRKRWHGSCGRPIARCCAGLVRSRSCGRSSFTVTGLRTRILLPPHRVT
jgi:hypothetical protein